MLNTKKLLYILPDVAYIAELLPAKKEHTFSIQNFRQINGEFLNDNEFIAENVEKLISKLDPEEYFLILPDFLFTNTIVEVDETSEAKVKEYIKEKLLPNLNLSKETHELKTFVLTEHGGKSKVQLSALEKSVMNPVSSSCEKHKVKIAGVAPLSWSIKSIVSLEPSITVLQMGSKIYLAQHYIGVDQTNDSSTEDVEKIGETIKTLKGAEPSIQTLYLLTSSLIEEKLKEELSGTLPLQQLAVFKEEESEMPSYVKQIIESSMKTLSIEEFPVPSFPLSKPTGPVEEKSKDSEKEVEEETETPTIAELDTSSEKEEAELPKPSATPAAEVAVEAEVTAITATALLSDPEQEEEDSSKSSEELEEADNSETYEKEEADLGETDSKEKEPEKESTDSKEEEKTETKEKEKEEVATKPLVTSSPVIKNKTGLQPMLKMVFISVAVFFATVGIGVGLGLGFISLSQRGGEATPEPSPIAIVEASPEPSPSPSPEPEIDKSELSILVVNATTQAGYAGETESTLEDAEFGSVDAGNAKGDYEEGTFVLMKERNEALISLLEESVDKTLTFSEEVTIEDPQGKYDAVIVLAE